MDSKEKKLYWDHRNKGIRGQGAVQKPTVTRNLAIGRQMSRSKNFGPTMGISAGESAHHKRQAAEKASRIKRKEQGERDRIAKNTPEQLSH